MEQAGVMQGQGRVRLGRIRVWLQASRAFTLGMPFMSVTVGSFLAFYAGASLSLPK
jgi:1,4-dihydroxy-2-naphthoate octaprenyltransferase